MKNKNVWLIPTTLVTLLHHDSKRFFSTPTFQLSSSINSDVQGFNIYITKEDEDLKETDYVITKDGRLVEVTYLLYKELEGSSKVVLTTDLTLLKAVGGISLIFNNVLQYFIVKANDSGKFTDIVEVEKTPLMSNNGNVLFSYSYSINLPKEDVECTCVIGKQYSHTCDSVHGILPSQTPTKEIEEEMFELEQQLDIPSNLRWHNRESVDSDSLLDIEKPIGDFILKNATPIQGADGAYFHYSDVCKLIRKKEKQMYSKEDMINASKYGYNFHKTTSFPEQEFEQSCVNNTKQWLTSYKK